MIERLCENPACRNPLVRHDGEGAKHFERRRCCGNSCGRAVAEASRKQVVAAKPKHPCRCCGAPVTEWRRRGGYDTCANAARNARWPVPTDADTADFSGQNLKFQQYIRRISRPGNAGTYGGVGSAWMA